MNIATWNVNSVRARQERLLAWLARHQPDLLCLQELKVEDSAFPHQAIRSAGYFAAVHGQRTYNGVAILSRIEPTEIERGFPEWIEEAQARLISARFSGIRAFSVYVPNGSEVGSDKWSYKLEWLKRLRRHLAKRCTPQEPVVVCGDFNVAPEERDVANPADWESTVLFHREARDALRELTSWGLEDVFRRHHSEGGHYSWWDYRALAFPRNDGLRIDHILATAPLAQGCRSASIDRQERKGKLPSDHAPVIAEFDV